RLEGLRREVQHPRRLDRPVLHSKTFGTTQPYLSVLRDPDTRRYRIWYNHGPAIWHAESDDAIRWRNPRAVWSLARCYGCSLVDEGPKAAGRPRRYKMAFWSATRPRDGRAGDTSGMYVGFSPDG